MAQKPTKIDDVKRPGRVAPSATSRPILVTNRPMMANDPMVVPATQEVDTAQPTTAARTAKVIKPLDSIVTTDTLANQDVSDLKSSEVYEDTDSTAPKLAVDSDEFAAVAETTETAPKMAEAVRSDVATPAAANEKAEEGARPGFGRDPEAELSAEEIAAAEAQAKRDLELEQLITSGKYHVPINAVQRRRSRVHVLLLCAIGVLLALVLADVVIDAGFVRPPINLPHTHFFSTTTLSS